MKSYSNRIQQISESASIALASKVIELKIKEKKSLVFMLVSQTSLPPKKSFNQQKMP